MYINGKQLAQDKGGVGVQNMKDWTQHENFFIGRNVGGAGQVFANFYIASFVMFNSYLEAPAVYSVAKYYSRDGELFQHIASALVYMWLVWFIVRLRGCLKFSLCGWHYNSHGDISNIEDKITKKWGRKTDYWYHRE